MTLHASHVRSERASTLVVAVLVIAVLATILGVAFDYTANTAIQSGRSQDLTAEQSTAEGVLEGTFVAWKNYMSANQSLPIGGYTETSDFTTLLSPILTGFNSTLSNSNYVVTALTINAVDRTDSVLTNGHTTASWTLSPPTVPGWIGRSYNYRARVTVAKWLNKTAGTKDASRTCTVSRYFQTTDCSLFQAMMFFQNDLELNPGADMTVSGLVATNANLYLSAHNGLTFNSNVSYHGSTSTLTPAAKHPSNAIYDMTGYIEGVTQSLYDQEGLWDNYNNPKYANSKSSQLSPTVPSLDPLGMSADLAVDNNNANASGTHEIIERPVPTSKNDPTVKPGTSDPTTYAAHRLYNSAGLRIFINRANASPVTVYTPASSNVENSTAATAALTTAIAATITTDTGTGDIYDMREGHNINASTVDMSKLTPVLNAYPSYNGVVYITDVTNMDSNGEMGNSDAIRIKKGGVLPDNGLTLVSDGAVYVQGDYNTGTTYKSDSSNGAINLNAKPSSDTTGDSANYTVSGYTAKPAAVIGDAVMILSNSWLDSNSSKTLSARAASGTTFNAALVTGQVLTNADNASGGAHNLPRFLETWSGLPFAYHGSMVELYASKHFTGAWNTGNIYAAPNRYWYFDTSYLTAPPPGNLRSTTYTRGRWVRESNP